MSRERRAVNVLVVVAVLTVPLAVASLAFACARLSTLKLDRAGGTPGATTAAFGRNYNFDAKSSTVTLRFNSRRGKVLWEGRADTRGRIAGSFQIPNARPGHYVILATQTSDGRPVAGTPGRAPLTIRSRRGRRSATPVTAALPPAGGAEGQGGPPGILTAAAPLLLLFGVGAGTGAFAVSLRRRTSARAHA